MEQPITLRRQANPLLFHQLTDSQRQVCTQILKMLQAYGLHNQNQSTIGSVQTDRVNNLIFIDGNRGIGKSTVMLSLIQGCKPQTRANFLQSVPATQTADAESVWLKENIWKDSFLDQLVWLDILDLELLPQNTNLLASILVRIENAFKHVSEFSETEKKSVLFPSTPTHPWTDFKKLMNDVSLGWDSSLIQRRNTDPDTYSQELMRTERARLSFASFHESLEKIGKLYQELKRTQFKPLFILPVDDADLNPHRYLELFRLTRLLNCNNLIFLVAGNAENLELLLELSFANELNQISSANFLKDRHERISGLAGKLGYAAYRKLIPPSPHLIRVKPLSVEEGFLFKPANAPEVADPTEVTFDETITDWTVHGLLAEIRLPSEDVKNPFYRDYLKPAKCLADLIDLSSTHETSSLAYVVSGPSRAIYDLWLELFELYQKSDQINIDEGEDLADLIAFLADAYRNALNESHDFPNNIQEQFIDLFLPTGGYSIQQRIQRQSYVEPESLSRIYESPNKSKENYQFRKPGPFKLSLIDNQKRYTLKDNWKNAWGFLLHDVSLIMPGNTIERLDLSKTTYYWAQSHLFSSQNEMVINWPCPDWFSIHYSERFRLYWNDCLDNIPNFEKLNAKKLINAEIIPTPLNYLAYCWIWGITCLIYTPAHLSVPQIDSDDGYGNNVSTRWEELASWISSLSIETPADWSSLRNSLKNQWINQLIPVILAPETGLPLECIRKFQNYIQIPFGQGTSPPTYSHHLSPAWGRFSKDIVEARANNIIKYFDGKLMISLEQAKRNIELLEPYYANLKNSQEIKTFTHNPIEIYRNGNDTPLALSHVIAKAKAILSSLENLTQPLISPAQREHGQPSSLDPSNTW